MGKLPTFDSGGPAKGVGLASLAPALALQKPPAAASRSERRASAYLFAAAVESSYGALTVAGTPLSFTQRNSPVFEPNLTLSSSMPVRSAETGPETNSLQPTSRVNSLPLKFLTPYSTLSVLTCLHLGADSLVVVGRAHSTDESPFGCL